MNKFTSNDGTRIAYHSSGSGPPLVLVHGTAASSARWMPVLPAFETHFRVYAVDRRGRGESDHEEASDYALEREAEDIAALIDGIGQPVYVLGHSFGGICTLEAALLIPRVQKMILYEPPIVVNGAAFVQADLLDRLDALLAAGDREGVLTTFVQEVLRMPAHEFEVFRSSPAWPARLAAAHTLPRELRAQMLYHFDTERFKKLTVPTLLLLGGDSAPLFKAATELVHVTLPNSRIVILPDQKHIAMDTAPELFAHQVLNFLSE